MNMWGVLRSSGFVVAFVLSLAVCAAAQSQSTILSDVQVRDIAGSVQMVFTTSRTIPVECYDLTNPPQIIVDFMGDIYSNRRDEVVSINKAGVRQMRVVRGTRASADLDAAYYPVDFMIIDLEQPQRYSFNQGLNNAVLVIGTPEKVTLPPTTPELLPVPFGATDVRSARETSAPPSYEQEPDYMSPAAPSTPSEQAPAAVSAREEERPTKTRRAERKTRSTRRRPEASGTEPAPRRARTSLFGRRQRTAARDEASSESASAAAVRQPAASNVQRQLEIARQEKSRRDEAVDALVGQLQEARQQVTQAEHDALKVEERAKVSQYRLEQARAEVEQHNAAMEQKKETASQAYRNFTMVKDDLSEALRQGVPENVLNEKKQHYEASKNSLEKVINDAEQLKNSGTEKILLYQSLQKEAELTQQQSSQPQREIELATTKKLSLEKQLEQAMAQAGLAAQAVTEAEAAVKKHEMELTEAEYRKSLAAIDSSLLRTFQEEEKQRRLEEERKEQQLVLQKQLEEEQKMRERMKALEEDKQRAAAEEKVKAAAARDEARSRDRAGRRKKRAVPTTVKGDGSHAAVELRNSGLELQRNGDLDGAMRYYQQALLKDPNFVTVHNDLGILYEQKGFNDKARDSYLAALAVDPRYIRAHSNLALLFEKTGDLSKAYYHWRQRAELGDPQDVWTQRARTRMQELEQK